MVAMKLPQITVTQAAERLGKTTGRIRQICRSNSIGVLYGGHVRLLSETDVHKIESVIKNDRRRKKSEKSA